MIECGFRLEGHVKRHVNYVKQLAASQAAAVSSGMHRQVGAEIPLGVPSQRPQTPVANWFWQRGCGSPVGPRISVVCSLTKAPNARCKLVLAERARRPVGSGFPLGVPSQRLQTPVANWFWRSGRADQLARRFRWVFPHKGSKRPLQTGSGGAGAQTSWLGDSVGCSLTKAPNARCKLVLAERARRPVGSEIPLGVPSQRLQTPVANWFWRSGRARPVASEIPLGVPSQRLQTSVANWFWRSGRADQWAQDFRWVFPHKAPNSRCELVLAGRACHPRLDSGFPLGLPSQRLQTPVANWFWRSGRADQLARRFRWVFPHEGSKRPLQTGSGGAGVPPPAGLRIFVG